MPTARCRPTTTSTCTLPPACKARPAFLPLPTNWYEYTGTPADTTLPTVTSAVPYNGATGVGVNVAPGVIFSKAIDPVSVNSNTFQVTNGGTPLAGSYWFNSSNTRIEFVPNAPLPANTILTMSLNGVLDQVGNPVTFSSSFTTGAGARFHRADRGLDQHSQQ